ncbi:hypothetical protein [Aquamicrobium sp. LC103]|uniref:ImuA family protein n=1 Tax=Aquamicrobium sp. LC103 TaxID=1120658 RepID=UPI000A8E62AF|nr:hypothetical protein [Aquamicrobium sp. LC103]TKT82911.1 hypothetical protein XW59_002810 [Aquamicrobium sp. LC103]
MATSAVAHEAVFALRREIARIEGVLPERLEAPETARADEAGIVLRRAGIPGIAPLPTGVERLDAVLGGGLPNAALTEIHGRQTRDAGATAGFALALAGLALAHGRVAGPVLWIGTSEIFREAGMPYAPGLLSRFGIRPESLLFSRAGRLEEALWIAEEAAGLKALAAVILEMRGTAARLDLTATRRLHRRAQLSERPFLLLRQAAQPEPTAAPVRFLVASAPAAPRQILSMPLPGSIGRPAFNAAVTRSRTAMTAQFTLEWNSDERTFHERLADAPAQDTGVVVSPSADGQDHAAASGEVLAFPAAGGAAVAAAPPRQPPREEHPAHRRPRRAG